MAAEAIVVGAGVFGVCIAERLARDGRRVLLVERDEPGGPRATSSSATRIIRCGHGRDRFYTRMARRARAEWREIEARSGRSLLLESGIVWLASEEDGFEAATEATLGAEGIPAERLSVDEVAARFPSFAPDGLRWALLEPEAGILRAREAVLAVLGLARREGVELVRGQARPDGDAVRLGDARLEADLVVWACGPWLGRLFPGLVDVRPVRREYATFAAGPEWSWERVPAFYEATGPDYGLPGVDGAGVKIAPDRGDEPFDPDLADRRLHPDTEREARGYLARRFPALAGAPLTGGRVCQYELTPDSHFVLAPHPEHPHVWLAGGGSGHGFKHGPALAEHVAGLVDGRRQPDPAHGLGPRGGAGGSRSAAVDLSLR